MKFMRGTAGHVDILELIWHSHKKYHSIHKNG